jgi:hypothetical protein
MVRALLDGSKTQTRRVVKPWAVSDLTHKPVPADLEYLPDFTCYRSTCPYGQPGDRLWVRETWRGVVNIAPPGSYEYAVARYIPDREYCRRVEYAASQELDGEPWRPSIHMPRWASRITLEITEVRVERLQAISEADSIAEGIEHDQDISRGNIIGWRDYLNRGGKCGTANGSYRSLWESINGPDSWSANPWVWAVSFKRLENPA